jgi:hypothetical protein
MAKFEPGERVIYVAVPPVDWDRPFIDNEIYVVVGVKSANHEPRALPGRVYYELEGFPNWYVGEPCLRKIPPKHQDSDLKAAEPHFIHGQLQRWLNPEKEKTFEKSN